MGARTAAREAALQMLYAADLGQHTAETLLKDFWREFPGDAEGRSYADSAVRGVLADRAELDQRVIAASANWRLERMSPVARNVLRLGTWELLNHPEIPRAVIIDESVELAKRYAGQESGAFVNGVLDRIADTCGRAHERQRPSSPPKASAPASGEASTAQGASSAATPSAPEVEVEIVREVSRPPEGAIPEPSADDDF
jgi:transcription antitermination protein NusB